MMEQQLSVPFFTAQRRAKYDKVYFRLRRPAMSDEEKSHSMKIIATDLKDFLEKCRVQASIAAPQVRTVNNEIVTSEKAFQKLDANFLVVDLSVKNKDDHSNGSSSSSKAETQRKTALPVLTAGPRPYPIIGNIPQLSQSFFLQSHALLQQYGPVIRIEAFFAKAHVTNDARVAEKVLSNPTQFPKLVREGTLYELRRLAGDALFTASDTDENWGVAHRILLPAFSRASIEKYTPEIIRASFKFLGNLQSFYGGGAASQPRDIPLLDWTTKMTFDTIGICGTKYAHNACAEVALDLAQLLHKQTGFGHDFKSLDSEEEAPPIKWMVKILNEALAREMRGSVGNFVNIWAERSFEKYIGNFHRLVEDLVRSRRTETAEEQVKRMDLMSLMLTGVDTQTGKQLSDTNIIHQCVTFLIAGHETTSALLSWSFYFISLNPLVESKLLDEIDSVFGADDEGSTAPTHQQLSKLKYVTYIIKEALRLFPPVGSVEKALLQQEELEFLDPSTGAPRKGLTDPSATSIVINTYSLHRNKLYWGDDAEEFKPERWTPDAAAARATKNGSANPFTWLPFSFGPRSCIGMQFALLEAQIVLAMFYRKFVLRVSPNAKVTVQTQQSVTMRPENLFVRLHPRLPRHQHNAATPKPASEASSIIEPPAFKQLDAEINLLVLYGSNTGTSEDIAHKLVHMAQMAFKGSRIRGVKPLDEGFKLLRTHRDANDAIVIVSSTYNGQPPDNANQFNKWLENQKQKKNASQVLSGCKFAVLGVGNSQWATFQAFPRKIDTALEILGAERYIDSGEIDVDGSWEEHFIEWRTKWITQLVRTFVSNSSEAAEALKLSVAIPLAPSSYSIEIATCPVVHGSASSSEMSSCPASRALAVPHVPIPGAQPWKILSRSDLQSAESDRRTLHIELKLPEGVIYEVGDHLGVCPRNSLIRVQALAQRLQLDLAQWVVIDSTRPSTSSGITLPLGTPIQLRSILQYYVDLSATPSMSAMAILAEFAQDAAEKEELLRISQGETYRKIVLQQWKTLLELLVEFPSISLPLNRLLDVLPRMQPRFYSISSSPLECKDKLSITVGVAQQISPAGRVVDGVCSNFLASIDPNKDFVVAFVRDLSNRSTPFKLPEDDPSAPIIMIGAGTGIAPYMGFLQQRRAFLLREGSEAKLGSAYLYFGCRNVDVDDLYAAELQQMLACGALQHLHVAYSRQSLTKKEYCQDLIERDGTELWKLLIDQKARVFVCGSASGLAQGVRRAFVKIAQVHGSRTPELAERFLASLEESGSYVADVWG